MYQTLDSFNSNTVLGAVNSGINYADLSGSLDTIRTDAVRSATGTSAPLSSYGNNVLKNLSMSNITAWVKTNPLLAAAAGVGIFFVLKKLLKF